MFSVTLFRREHDLQLYSIAQWFRHSSLESLPEVSTGESKRWIVSAFILEQQMKHDCYNFIVCNRHLNRKLTVYDIIALHLVEIRNWNWLIIQVIYTQSKTWPGTIAKMPSSGRNRTRGPAIPVQRSQQLLSVAQLVRALHQNRRATSLIPSRGHSIPIRV